MLRSLKRRAVAGIIALAIYGGISVLSSLPAGSIPSAIPDIIPHFIEYALLAFFFIQVFRSPHRPKTMVTAFSWLVLMAALDELHQRLVPGRFCSLKDLAVDALGCAAGIAAFCFLLRWAKTTPENSLAGRLAAYLSRD